MNNSFAIQYLTSPGVSTLKIHCLEVQSLSLTLLSIPIVPINQAWASFTENSLYLFHSQYILDIQYALRINYTYLSDLTVWEYPASQVNYVWIIITSSRKCYYNIIEKKKSYIKKKSDFNYPIMKNSGGITWRIYISMNVCNFETDWKYYQIHRALLLLLHYNYWSNFK